MSSHGLTMPQGLPGELPRGERVLWVGGPDAAALGRHALHLRKLAVYFALLLAWRLYAVWHDGYTFEAARSATITTVLLAAFVLGALWVYSRVSARSTQYTITNERIVIRTGVALSIATNLPFSRIVSADVRRREEGGGDIVLALEAGDRAGYAILWPSVRPFQLMHPQPMLRALPRVEPVAALLAAALASHAGTAAAEAEEAATPDGALAAG